MALAMGRNWPDRGAKLGFLLIDNYRYFLSADSFYLSALMMFIVVLKPSF